MRPSSCSALARLTLPSARILFSSSSVSISCLLVCCRVSISTMPRSDSLAMSMVPCLSVAAFLRSSSLVASVTARSACMACWLWAMPRASTIWFFHSGIVLTMVVWIFSAIIVSFDWIRRICGPIWMETLRVSSKSYSFFSKRSHRSARSRAAWASSGSWVRWAFSCAAFRSVARTCSSFFLPARMYMVSSLK